MFPLGTVLFPSAVLPLHVFEPRYQALVRHCLATEPEFGVVLIERGSEVGGGDVRSAVGTVARIVQLAELDGGRFALVAVGVRRMRVQAWLPDDPYPCADVDDWGDPAAPDGDDELHGLLDRTVARLRRTLAFATEAGASVASATSEVSVDPIVGSYQAAALAPLGPADAYRLLAATDARERLTLLGTFLDDADEALRFRLGAGLGPPGDDG